MPYFVPFLIPGTVFMTVAWIVCLSLLRRAQWLGWFRTVFTAPLLIVLVSLIAIMITWSVFAQTSAQYRTVAEGSYLVFFVTVTASILLALVNNLIVIVASHKLRHAGIEHVRLEGVSMISATVLSLGYLGLILFILGAGWLLLGFAFVCAPGCPFVANAPEDITRDLSYFGRFTLPGLLLLVLAWLGCIALLGRARLWRALVTLVVAPLAGIGLATWNMVRAYNDVVVFAAPGFAYYNWSTEMWQDAFLAWNASLWLMVLAITISGILIIMCGHHSRRTGRRQTDGILAATPTVI